MKQPRKRRPVPGTTQHITKAVNHIRLLEVNPGKLATLDTLALVYLELCQQYVTFFCTEEAPDKFHTPVFQTPLSERWHRVAIQQAAGIAQSWRTNRAQAYQTYLDELLDFHKQQTEGALDESAQEPTWREWDVPTLRQTCIQANANVVALEPSEDSSFDYWLKISTLDFRKPLLVPLRLADYHRKALDGQAINSSVTLNKRKDSAWWLTLSYDEVIVVQTESDVPVIGVDVGIANFLTTSDGKHYGTFHGHLRERQKRAMNAYMRASNLAHIPKQIAWNAAKRGVQATRVKSAYSSQECQICHYPDRANRPDQQTFCCAICGFQTHADTNAAMNIARRLGDSALQACKDRHTLKALLMQRHQIWKTQHGWP